MKKIKQILTGVLLIMTLSVFTACGNNGTAPDEVDTTNENTDNTESTADDEKQNADKDDKNNNNAKDNADNNATDNENMTDDAGIDNGDTVSEGPEGAGNAGNGTVDGTTAEEGTVARDLGDGVRAVGDGVGDAVEDVGNAVGDVVDGRE